MKRLIALLSVAFLFSCSDYETNNEKSDQPSKRLTNLNLLAFDNSCIVQGVVIDAVAQANLVCFETQIALAVSQGKDGLNVVGLDCFFKVGTSASTYIASTNGINLPSGFTLQMDKNTHLRVQPMPLTFIGGEKHQLLGIFEKDSINIYGGNLHGDRMLHNNDEVSGHLLNIVSGRHVNVEDTKFFEANGDGICIWSSHPAYEYEPGNPEYIPAYLNSESSQISILNCFFDKNRRNNMSITNGNNITVDGCNFKNAGITTSISNGKAPSLAIDIEAQRHRDTLGNINSRLILDEHAHHITVKNCKESGSRLGGFLASIGDHVVFNNNDTENYIGLNLASDVEITNNTISRTIGGSYPTQPPVGISIGSYEVTNTVFANKVTGNTVENYPIGMAFNQSDCLVNGNTITNCSTGMQLKDLVDYTITHNTIINNDTNLPSNISARGIVAMYYGGVGFTNYLKNVTINNNEIRISDTKTTSYPMKFAQVNQRPVEENYTVVCNSNVIYSPALISIGYARGFTFETNILETGFTIGNSSKINILGNIINQRNQYNTIYMSYSHHVLIQDNAIRILPSAGDNNKCINAPSNDYITINHNGLDDSKNLATLWLPSTTNSIITNNTGNISTVADSPHFVASSAANASSNTITNNVATVAPFVRDWLF